MQESLVTSIKGVTTHPNPLSLPQGTLLAAPNCVMRKEDTVELRPGLKQYMAASAQASALFNYKNTLLLSYSNKMGYDSNGAGTKTDYSGTYSPPTGANRIKAVEANQNFLFTTNAGIKKLDSVTATPAAAGMYKALGGSAALTGVAGFMANNTQVAYRIIWGITDANGNKILGSPSDRIIATNASGGIRNVNVTFFIPSGITVSHFYQVYRSGQSGTSTDEPNDELQLVIERNPSAGEVVAKSVTYLDSSVDKLLGAFLYTSPSQEGILQANEPPPIARDVVLYKNMVFYANVVNKHRLFLTIVSVGGSGLVNDDTITIAGTVYTGKGAETPASGQFKITTGGTDNANIDATARSLVNVINQYASNTLVYAYYLTGYNDVPGQIMIEERGIGGSLFVSISSRGSAFSPTLPSSGVTYASSNSAGKNVIAVSKPLQPESVPILNTIFAGSASYDILAMVALRDSIFVFKSDGTYRITGETFETLQVSLFDSTVILTAKDSAVAVNNRVFCCTSKMIVSVSDSGVLRVSRPIESSLSQISSSQYTNFDSASFGVSYESNSEYIFATVTETTDTYATTLWVYNTLTDAWTWWGISASSGIVATSNNKLHLGYAYPSNLTVAQERKNFDVGDYADNEFDVVISNYSGTTVTVNSTANAVVGDSLAQVSGTVPTRNSVIVSIDSPTQLTVTDSLSWELGAAKIYQPIAGSLTFSPVHGGNPALLKHFQDVITFFNNADFDSIQISFTSDNNLTDDIVDVPLISTAPWGLFTWPGSGGGVPWGGDGGLLQPVRTFTPKEKSRANWLGLTISISQALTTFAFCGFAVFYEDISTKRK